MANMLTHLEGGRPPARRRWMRSVVEPLGAGGWPLGAAAGAFALGRGLTTVQKRATRRRGLTLAARGGEKSGEKSGRRQPRAVDEDLQQLMNDDDDVNDVLSTGETQATALNVETEPIPPPAPRYDNVRRESVRLLPFLPEPTFWKFALNTPGDAGFDPLNFSTDIDKFVQYREAELKHARLAMVVAIAWPLAEYEEPLLAEDLRLPDVLGEANGSVLPRLTGGNFDYFVELFLAAVLVIGAFAELSAGGSAPGASPGKKTDGFDPLGLADWKAPSFLEGNLPPGRQWMPEAEIVHGRLAMSAVLYDVVSEITTDTPVSESTEFFFHRLDVKFVNPDYWLLNPETL